MRELMQELSDKADFISIDTPPVLAVTDALVLGREVDGVILVVQYLRILPLLSLLSLWSVLHVT